MLQSEYSGVIVACGLMYQDGWACLGSYKKHATEEVCTSSMEASANRVAQVFVWKQGTVPDLAYARQVLSVVNPDAFAAVSGDNPPLQLFSIMGQWPDEPWPRVLQDMRAIPAPGGARWTDTTRYELQGWQGTDSRTGDRLFVVTVYY